MGTSAAVTLVVSIVSVTAVIASDVSNRRTVGAETRKETQDAYQREKRPAILFLANKTHFVFFLVQK